MTVDAVLPDVRSAGWGWPVPVETRDVKKGTPDAAAGPAFGPFVDTLLRDPDDLLYVGVVAGGAQHVVGDVCA